MAAHNWPSLPRDPLPSCLNRWLVLLFFVFKEIRGARVWLIVQHLYFGGLGFDLLNYQKLEIMS